MAPFSFSFIPLVPFLASCNFSCNEKERHCLFIHFSFYSSLRSYSFFSPIAICLVAPTNIFYNYSESTFSNENSRDKTLKQKWMTSFLQINNIVVITNVFSIKSIIDEFDKTKYCRIQLSWMTIESSLFFLFQFNLHFMKLLIIINLFLYKKSL